MPLNSSWTAQAQALTQHLRTHDRVAFPFGCGASGQFDRYCADGSLDLYDYRSENERRTVDSAESVLQGRCLRLGLGNFGKADLRAGENSVSKLAEHGVVSSR